MTTEEKLKRATTIISDLLRVVGWFDLREDGHHLLNEDDAAFALEAELQGHEFLLEHLQKLPRKAGGA